MCTVWLCAHVHAGTYEVQKGILDPLELGIQAVVNHLMGVLGIELESSVRAANVLNH